MKKLFTVILCFVLNINLIYADVWDGTTDFSAIDFENDLLNSVNQLTDIDNVPDLDMSMNTAIDASLDPFMDSMPEMTSNDTLSLTDSNDLLNPTVDALDSNSETLDLDNTVNDLDNITDFTDNLNDMNNEIQEDIFEGEIISDTQDMNNTPSEDNSNDSKETEDSEDSSDDNSGDSQSEDAFLLDFSFFEEYVYADNSTFKSDKYFLRTNNSSFIINTNDKNIKYFLSLITNQGIKVAVRAKQDSVFSLNVSYLNVVDEIPKKIWDKYEDYCTEQLKQELPTGVFFNKDNDYYFTESKTNNVIKVKTDDLQLQILIPIISNQGIKVLIDFYEIDKETIYISQVIILDDLPDDLANKYKEEYKKTIENTLFHVSGTIVVSNNKYILVSDSGDFNLSSEDKDIVNFILNNHDNNQLIKIYGYLNIDTNTMNVIKIEY